LEVLLSGKSACPAYARPWVPSPVLKMKEEEEQGRRGKEKRKERREGGC
jgi:hypothetical protein